MTRMISGRFAAELKLSYPWHPCNPWFKTMRETRP
jgi:hypothetical protein